MSSSTGCIVCKKSFGAYESVWTWNDAPQEKFHTECLSDYLAQLKTEIAFGKVVVDRAKQPNKSGVQTYQELDTRRRVPNESLGQAQVKKATTDKHQSLTNRVAAALFRFAAPNPSNPYEQAHARAGYLIGRSVAVLKRG